MSYSPPMGIDHLETDIMCIISTRNKVPIVTSDSDREVDHLRTVSDWANAAGNKTVAPEPEVVAEIRRLDRTAYGVEPSVNIRTAEGAWWRDLGADTRIVLLATASISEQ